jgi:hypothetical protein
MRNGMSHEIVESGAGIIDRQTDAAIRPLGHSNGDICRHKSLALGGDDDISRTVMVSAQCSSDEAQGAEACPPEQIVAGGMGRAALGERSIGRETLHKKLGSHVHADPLGLKTHCRQNHRPLRLKYRVVLPEIYDHRALFKEACAVVTAYHPLVSMTAIRPQKRM